MNPFAVSPLETESQVSFAQANPLQPGSVGARWYEGVGTGLVAGPQSAYYRDLFRTAQATKDEPLQQRALSSLGSVQPDPNTVGLVGQFAFQFTEALSMAGISVAGGNPTPLLSAIDVTETYKRSQTPLNIKAGMDPATAEKVAQAQAIGVGAGLVMPASVTGTLLARAASGAGINAVTGLATRADISSTLRAAGYDQMAEQYAPFHAASVMTDVALGAFFGGLLGPRPRTEPRVRINPSDVDAALAGNNASHVEIGTAPGIPADPAARAAHVEALTKALDDLINGREVKAPEGVASATFVPDPTADAARAAVRTAVEEHLGSDWTALTAELEKRNLPTDLNLYDIQPGDRPPVRFTDNVSSMLREWEANGNTGMLLMRLRALQGKLETRAALNAEVPNDLERGPLWIRERLLRAERNGEITPEARSLVEWMLDKNPNIANDLAISIRSKRNGDASGMYNPAMRLITLFKNRGNDETAAHEVLHHTERMMPEAVREGVREEWIKQLETLQRYATENQINPLMQAIDDAIRAAAGDTQAFNTIAKQIADGELPRSFYQFVNPSEFWAVNAARLVRERAEAGGWVAKAMQWLKEFIEKAKSVFGLDSQAAIIRGLDAVLQGDGTLTGRMIGQGGIFADVDAPGRGVARENLNGFEPSLRVITPAKGLKLPDKPLILTGTNAKNAARQIANIDDILARFPDADRDPLEWSRMMSYAMATRDVPIPPYRFLKDINSDGALRGLQRLTQGQIEDANHGFENARAFRQAYLEGTMGVEDTGKLFMWSFLSRGVSPYTQEGLFIDAFPGIGPWIKKAADGELTEADFPAYEAWAKSVAPQGSGQPGSGATHNLNAFGKLFLFKMGQRGEDGISRLQKLHELMADPNQTGPAIRRWFIENAEGVGIDNKVVSFTLLVAGFPDVMVLDRVQIRQLWDDGRFAGRNLYDGRKVDGKPVPGSMLSEITYGARGLLIYEAVERALAKRVENLYTLLGRPQDASIGRYHWETWVADSAQEASHGTLDAILAAAKGDAEAMVGVTAKEGEYGGYAYGARYGRDAAGMPYFQYTTPGGKDLQFTVPAFREFLAAVKSPKNQVVPTGFKVTEAGNAPWFERPEVNKQALDALAQRYASGADGGAAAGEGAGAVRAPGPGEAIPDQPGRGAGADYGPGYIVAQRPDLTVITEDGRMISAARALTDADAEIARAEADSQGYEAAVACALRG